MTDVYVVVPAGIDDPQRPSGGHTYDRRICRELTAIGWSVHERAVPGSWPRPDPAACAELARVLTGMPDGSVVLLDGLIASAVPEVLVPEAARLRLVILLHMPLGGDREREVLSAAAAVVTTSAWTRRELLDHYALRPGQVHVAEPGVDGAELAPGTTAGGELLCVAALTPNKGHDVLIAALADMAEMDWRCVCVGASTLDPAFVDRLDGLAHAAGIGDRVHFIGARTGTDLAAQYAAADVLVLASRAETYAMVVTEALSRGLPVIATSVGGLPDALGRGADMTIPGLLVPPDDPAAFTAALSRWLSEADLRKRLRRTAEERRTALSPWSATSAQLSRVLAQVAV
ncbi:MAG: glycosyltransferase [Aeromicrobium sp.]|nr:glycosyltransferase [Aeromicrobium sp.]